MWPAEPRPRQATMMPWPTGLGKVTVLRAGVLLVSAPGTGLLGPDHVAAGAANAAPAPTAQMVPATETAETNLVTGRLILDLAFY
jgi:hypothetical protein